MRLAVALGITLAASGCAERGELARAPRSPVAGRCDDPMPTRASPIEEHDTLAYEQHITPPREHPPSISLGYIGDQPIGVLPTPPHREPEWTRPFPCDWTNTCWMVPLVPYEPPYGTATSFGPSL